MAAQLGLGSSYPILARMVSLAGTSAFHPNRRILALAVAATNALHTSAKHLIRLRPLRAILRGASRWAAQLLDVTREAHGNCLKVQPEQ